MLLTNLTSSRNIICQVTKLSYEHMVGVRDVIETAELELGLYIVLFVSYDKTIFRW